MISARLEAKVEAVSKKVMPATVALLSEKTESSGSGVITTADGLILTAAHVTQGAEEVTVVFPDGEQVPGKSAGRELFQRHRDGADPRQRTLAIRRNGRVQTARRR